MNESEAISLVESKLASLNADDIDLVVTKVSKLPWGWVVFYNTRKFTETEDFRDGLAGNAPYLVDAKTGAVQVTGTALPVDEYIKNYERENGY